MFYCARLYGFSGISLAGAQTTCDLDWRLAAEQRNETEDEVHQQKWLIAGDVRFHENLCSVRCPWHLVTVVK